MSEQPLGTPQDREVLRKIRAPSLGVAVDKADDVNSVLGVLNKLSGDQLSDFAGADDQGVLLVRLGPLAGATCYRPGERQDAVASAQNVIRA